MTKRTVEQNPNIKLMDTAEYKFSVQMCEQAIQKIIEKYNAIGAEVIEIIEYVCTEEDIKEHIDAKFITQKECGEIKEHTWQIKILDKWNYRQNFTIEYHQNRWTGEIGEVGHIKARYYFHGYAQDGILKEYHIINVKSFTEWFWQLNKSIRDNYTRYAGGSRASFFWYNYDKLPRGIVVGQGV